MFIIIQIVNTLKLNFYYFNLFYNFHKLYKIFNFHQFFMINIFKGKLNKIIYVSRYFCRAKSAGESEIAVKQEKVPVYLRPYDV